MLRNADLTGAPLVGGNVLELAVPAVIAPFLVILANVILVAIACMPHTRIYESKCATTTPV